MCLYYLFVMTTLDVSGRLNAERSIDVFVFIYNHK